MATVESGRDETRTIVVTGTNLCDVGEKDVCPRVTAGCETGTGYELCGPPRHAEEHAVALLKERLNGNRVLNGVAYLYGHNWFCGPCQWALQEVGISTFIVTGKEAA